MPTRRTPKPETGDIIDTQQNAPQGATEWRTPIVPGAAHAGFVTGDDQDDIELSVGDRIRDLVAQSGADRVRIKVYRRDPRKASLEYCQDYSPEAFDDDGLSMLREDWGPGEYELRVIGSSGILARPRVSIAPMRNTAAPVDNSNSETAQMLRMMAEQNARILDALTNRPDPIAQMQPMLALMGAMREAMGMNTPPAAPAPPQSLAGSLAEMATTLKMLREISGDITPKEGDPDNPMALAMPILELVKTAVANRAPAPAAAPAPFPPLQLPAGPLPPMSIPPSLRVPMPRARPEPAPVVQESPAPEPETESESMPATQDEQQAADELRVALDELVSMAQRNAPVDEAAAFVADRMPDEILPLLETPFWFKFLCQVAPGLAAHEAWARQVKEAAEALLYEDDPADDSTPA